MLSEVGVKVNLVPIEFAQWLDQVFKNSNFDATIIAHAEARDLDIYARDKYYFNYQNPEYKALYKSYTLAATEAEQMDLIGQLQRKLAADEPNVFLYAAEDRRLEQEGQRSLEEHAGAGRRPDPDLLGKLIDFH